MHSFVIYDTKLLEKFFISLAPSTCSKSVAWSYPWGTHVARSDVAQSARRNDYPFDRGVLRMKIEDVPKCLIGSSIWKFRMLVKRRLCGIDQANLIGHSRLLAWQTPCSQHPGRQITHRPHHYNNVLHIKWGGFFFLANHWVRNSLVECRVEVPVLKTSLPTLAYTKGRYMEEWKIGNLHDD